MSEDLTRDFSIEPERYELALPPAYHFDMGRRDFFRILGAGVLVISVWNEGSAQQESGGGRRQFGGSTPNEIGAWLHIGEDGIITAYTGKAEVGQNVRTSLSQAVAEELRVPLEKIKMVMADTDLTPYDAGTFGSRSTPIMNPQLRRAAAAARNILLELAAAHWSRGDGGEVDRENLVAADGKVTDLKSKRTVEYGGLVKGRRLTQTILADGALAPAADWKILGKPLHKVDGRNFVTGVHRYSTDLQLPDMLFGKVLRPASIGATLVSVDSTDAEKMAGVVVVRDGDFIGVAAPTEEAASRALAAFRAEWKSEPQPQPSNKELFEYLEKNAATNQGSGREGSSRFTLGSIEQGLGSADHRLEQSYTVAYIAHAPLEPRAAVAQWTEEKLTVWTGTQRPFGVRSELAEAFRISEDRVRVIVPDTGSGYGGKHTGEAAIEAARLARAAKKPVRLVWTREEEFAWAYFRPAGVINVRSGVGSDGTITAWDFHNYNSGTAAIRTMYAIPNQQIEFHRTRSPLKQGSYRGLAATANHFARETHMDELAHLVKMDPLAFRLKNLKDERLRAVLEAAAKHFGWGSAKKEAGRGFGIAGGFEKGSYVASCVEVAVDRATRNVKIIRIVTAFECGAVVNPDGLRNQIEGCIIMGLGGALFESVQFENGRILNGAFSKYRVPRFEDVPPLEIVLLDRKDLPSAGAGETPIVGVAPAIGNAIFDATGIRLRSLPLILNNAVPSQQTA
jgi:isoquinoline 1-oxidoreductase